MTPRLGRWSRLLATASVLACGDSSGPDGGGDPATAIAIVSGADQTGPVGTTLSQPLVVKVTNATGAGVRGKVVTFRVAAGGGAVSPAADTTDDAGNAQTTWRLGNSTADGQRAEAQTAGVTGAASFLATTVAGPASQMEKLTDVGCVIPGTSGARDVVVRVRDSFGNAVAQARVDWTATGGGSVTPATSNTDSDGRASARWSASAASGQSLSASATGAPSLQFAVQLAASRTINVGHTLAFSGDESRCNDFAAGNARYLVAVTNTTPDANSISSFSLSGGLAGSAAIVDAFAAAQQSFTRATGPRTLPPQALEARREAAERLRLFAANMEVVRRMQSAYPTASRQSANPVAAAVVAEPVPNVGDTLNIKVPNVRSLSCQLSALQGEIRARVVYAGTRGVVLEDIAAPLAGTMDDLYRQVGQEFDNVMWPILTNNFGDPLAFDAQTDANQRIFMVFSKLVNDMQTIAGFVVSTDFYSPTTAPVCPISNKREIFYARVPTSTATGNQLFRELTRENWFRITRTVVIHEAKHLVAFAHRFARTGGRPSITDFEQSWLEEASAMLAEELWARSVYGYEQRGNVDYRSSIFCEVRPANFPECPPPTKPRSMFDHFFLLHDFEVENERLSPLGSTGGDDFTWYGSGWAFLRWALDHTGGNESTFLRDLTQSTLRGVENLQARTGRSFADLITDWTLMLALDDRSGFTAPRPQLTMPGWNLPDIFAGLSNDFPPAQGGFQAAPLALRNLSYGTFSVNVDRVQGGSMSVFEVSGSLAGRQLLEFKSSAGGTLPAALRVTVVRLQ
ncbi:MAG: Ig-like domain-containing protein [Longimicrobiales bacterium]